MNINFFDNIKNSGRKIELYCSGDKPLDKYISKYFDTDFRYIQIKNKPFVDKNYYVNVFSDYIIEVFCVTGITTISFSGDFNCNI